MKCKLCLKNSELKKSHIIPEFIFRPHYDEKGRLIEVSGKKNNFGFIQKGIREKLLCGSCEQFINDNYEKYFHRIWYLEGKLPKDIVGCIYVISEFNYVKLKLFLLSILWRASVASGEAFSYVSLGPHEEKIRDMLINQHANSDNEYQIFGALLYFSNTKKACFDVIMTPIVSKYDGRRIYMFVFGGCAWYIVISSHPIVPPLSLITLRREGKLALFTMSMDEIRPVDQSLVLKIDRDIRKAGLDKNLCV